MTSIKINTESLIEASSWVTKNFDPKDVRTYITLTIQDNMGSLAHLTSSSFMKSDIVVEENNNSEKLNLALDGRYVSRLGGALNKQHKTATLTLTEQGLKVSTKNGAFTIPTLEKDPTPTPETVKVGEVDDRELFDYIRRLAKLCDANNTSSMPALGAVDLTLQPDEQKIIIMATDRYSLGEIQIDYTPSTAAKELEEELQNILIPVENANMISPSKGVTSLTTIVYEKSTGKFGYEFEDGRVALFALKEADSIDYSKIKQNSLSSSDSHAKLQTSDLKNAIATVSSLAWEDTNIYLTFKKNEIVVSDAMETNKIKVNAETSVNDEDEEMKFKFIRSVINEAFNPVMTKDMVLQWGTNSQAFVITPILDNGDKMDNVFVFFVSSK